jgi:hypothetical protein
VSSEVPLSKVLAHLETQIKQHREREAYHAEQEARHREQRAREAAGLATALQSFETLKAAAGTAAEIAARVPPTAPPPARKLPPGKTKLRTALVAELLEDLPDGEVFGPTRIAEELNQHYGRALVRPADSRFISSALRRLLAYGWLELVQKGTPHHEAQYRKV